MYYIIEGLFVGLVMAVIGVPIFLITNYFTHNKVESFGTNFAALIIGLFLVGFFGHIILEKTGLNAKYCKTGYACKKLKENI
jgi:hypothetical protein